MSVFILSQYGSVENFQKTQVYQPKKNLKTMLAWNSQIINYSNRKKLFTWKMTLTAFCKNFKTETLKHNEKVSGLLCEYNKLIKNGKRKNFTVPVCLIGSNREFIDPDTPNTSQPLQNTFSYNSTFFPIFVRAWTAQSWSQAKPKS